MILVVELVLLQFLRQPTGFFAGWLGGDLVAEGDGGCVVSNLLVELRVKGWVASVRHKSQHLTKTCGFGLAMFDAAFSSSCEPPAII